MSNNRWIAPRSWRTPLIFGLEEAVSTDVTGTAAFSVPQPELAATGTVTAPPTVGTAAFSVPQPILAVTGTVTASSITGTAAFTVPQPLLAITGTVPVTTQPGGGGRSRRRAVVHRYPPRRTRVPMDLGVRDLVTGSVAFSVPQPEMDVRGDIVSPAEQAADERMLLKIATDDEDLALALTVADAWT